MKRARFVASAPVRLDFAGGWTDVPPFPDREKGMVVNAAIDLRVQAEVQPGGDRFVLKSEDLDQRLELERSDQLEGEGPLGLLRAALRRSGLGPAAIRTRSAVPLGSGLGSSGALDVALVAALDAARQIRRPPVELAEEAYRLEAVEAGLPGGRQDQYAAALGSFHRLTFAPGGVTAEPLPIEPGFADHLGERIVVCYTGTSRLSSRTIERVMASYTAGHAPVVDALRGLAAVAAEMAEALVAADLSEVARLLSANWDHQQRLDPGMRTEVMARLEHAMASAGALGGKAAGAGAGGSMFFVIAGDRGVAEQTAREAGARVLPCRWSREGVRIWSE